MPCRKCGYDLIGLDKNPNCPECGALNLHTQPYRGIEVFRYCPQRHSKTLLFVIGLLGLFTVAMLIEGHSGPVPAQRPPTRPYGLMLGLIAVFIGGYFISRFYGSKGQVSLDWDKRKIIVEHSVSKRCILPVKRRKLVFDMDELRQIGKGNPLGMAYDVLRLIALHRLTKNNGPAWTFLTFAKCQIYVHRSLDNIELLELRLSRLYPPPIESTPLSKRVFTLPLALAIIIILSIAATFVWLAIRNDYWV